MSGLGLFAVGLSWRTAPVAVREQLAFREEELGATLQTLVQKAPVAEAILISTCNRVEVYGIASDRRTDVAPMVKALLLAERKGSPEAAQAMYAHVGHDALRHVFRVASALDSLVVGEAQILGQLKAAYATANQAGTVGPLLTRCLDRAFGAAKRVRTETAIARGAANVSSVAVELALRVFGELQGKTILVVGAGKMSRLAAKHLLRAGASQLIVTNRSIERAEALAAEIGGLARPWSELATLLTSADVVISSTGAREPVLTHKLFKQVTKARRWRPMVVVDIAVPRDAEPKIADFDGVYLFDIDDLQKVVDSNLSERAKASAHAQDIVAAEADAFEAWLVGQHVVPTIRALRTHVTTVAQAEAAKVIEALQKRPHSQAEQAEQVARLAQVIANKLLHSPTTVLKQSTGEVAKARADAACALFGIAAVEADEPAAAGADEATLLTAGDTSSPAPVVS